MTEFNAQNQELFRESDNQLIIGASQGIGLALVKYGLITSSARVMAASRQASRSDALLNLRAQYPGRLILVDLDITDEQSVMRYANSLGDQCLRLVVNTTGILHREPEGIWPEKRIEDLEAQSFEALMRVNAWGNALLLKALLPFMDRAAPCWWGVLSARVGSIEDNKMGGWYSYRASKAALNQIIKTASIECQRRYPNLTLAALHPGTTDTQLSKPFQKNVPPEKLFTPEFVADRLMSVLMGLAPIDSGGFFAWDGQPIPY